MSDQMTDEKLNALKALRTPAAAPEARRRALELSMAAFDAAQAGQGNPLGVRLRSMFSSLRGTLAMNSRLNYGLGTAAIALLLLPLGYQLYTSTAITPPSGTMQREMQVPKLQAPEEAAIVAGQDDAAGRTRTVIVTANGGSAVQAQKAEIGPGAPVPAGPPAVEAEMAADSDALASVAPAGDVARPRTELRRAAPQPVIAGAMAEFAPAPPPLIQPQQQSGDMFTGFAESPVKIVANEPVSTFSIDVDTASYSYVRKMLGDGYVPAPDAVRIEEMINYFPYSYAAATDPAKPFEPTVSVYPTPWNGKTQIVQIGIKGFVPPPAADTASNLVFLIDTSGSMNEPDKLPLLKRAFALLVDQLGDNDTVSIVVYAGSAGVVLPPTKATERAKILSALENLSAGGSTAGSEGIELAYRLAEQGKVSNGVNRVILATDGDFNVGIDDPEQLKTYIKGKRDSGVFLSVLGFGAGNLGDDTMQALAQNGNGNASYIDSFKEAQKVLVAEGGGTLQTIAKDVKIQVEFNPTMVSEYRLIGYETRALKREDFNNDKVDAGDIGAGTSVTALYEVTPVGSGAELNDPLRYGTAERSAVPANGELAYLKMRYKLPDSDTSQLIERPIGAADTVAELSQASDDSRWAAAVAAFAQKLKGSNYGDMDWNDIRDLAQGARGPDADGYRAEFMQMINMARTLEASGAACTAPPQNRNCR